MKTYIKILLTISISICCFSSLLNFCSDDDNSAPATNVASAWVGTWNSTNVNRDAQDITASVTMQITIKSDGNSSSFKIDPNGTSYDTGVYNVNTSVTPNQLTITTMTEGSTLANMVSCTQDCIDSMIMQISSNTMTISMENESTGSLPIDFTPAVGKSVIVLNKQ